MEHGKDFLIIKYAYGNAVPVEIFVNVNRIDVIKFMVKENFEEKQILDFIDGKCLNFKSRTYVIMHECLLMDTLNWNNIYI